MREEGIEREVGRRGTVYGSEQKENETDVQHS